MKFITAVFQFSLFNNLLIVQENPLLNFPFYAQFTILRYNKNIINEKVLIRKLELIDVI